MTTDAQLLQRYTSERSDQAFGELVSRHIDLVYSAALRVVGGDTHLAQDVAQIVFADLARKARALPRGVVLPGWLYRHTCFTASKAVRTERRRQAREQIAIEMTTFDTQSDAKWDQIAPFIDEGLNDLNSTERDAIVLRFLKQQDLRTVGAALGVSEDGAQKRVSRALEKLRLFFKKRGATLSAATLASVLAADAVTATPAGLAASVTAASLTAAAATSVGAAFMNFMALTKAKTAILSAALIAGLTTPLVLQHRQLNATRQEKLTLQNQLRDLDHLREENSRLAKLQVAADELERLRKDNHDLLRLRGQVASLRSLNEELLKNHATTESSKRGPRLGPSAYVPAEKIADAGLATPEAAVQTFLWSMLNQDEGTLKDVLDVKKFDQAMHEASHKLDPDFEPGNDHEGNFSINSLNVTGKMDGFQILSQQFNSSDEVEMEIAATDGDRTETNRITFHRVDDEWKLDVLALINPDSLYFTNTVTEPDGSERAVVTKLNIEESKQLKLVPKTNSP